MVDGELFCGVGHGEESIFDSVPRNPPNKVGWKGTQLNRKSCPYLPYLRVATIGCRRGILMVI